MSQAQVPALCDSWSGWRDEDFYRLKLVCDRVARIGFLFYLFHPKQALRDFRLWLRFRNTIKKVPKIKVKKTWFKTGKQKKDFKKVESVKSDKTNDLSDIEKKIDDLVDKTERKE